MNVFALDEFGEGVGGAFEAETGIVEADDAKIFPRILKQRSSPHCRFSVASGKARQYWRMASAFMKHLRYRDSANWYSRGRDRLFHDLITDTKVALSSQPPDQRP